jgi:hypothetical protein
MYDNLLIVTIIILALWLGATAYYLYTSRQQEGLEKDIAALHNQLDKKGEAG